MDTIGDQQAEVCTIGEQKLKQMQLGSKKQASKASELLIVFTFAVYTICVSKLLHQKFPLVL